MKRYLLVIPVLLWGQFCIAQSGAILKHSRKATALFSGFDFNNGGYYFLGHRGIRKSNTELDSIGDFYIDNIKTLNLVKEKFVLPFKNTSDILECEQYYFVDVCKNGQSAKEYTISKDCEKVTSSNVDKNETYFYYHNYSGIEYSFNQSELLVFKDSFKKAYIKEQTFSSLELARNYFVSILNDSNLILALEPIWIKFDGALVITYTHNLKCKHYVETVNRALTNLSKEIRRNYPNEVFYLDSQGLGESNMVVEIYCNKELADKFNLYPIECCKWEQFELKLISYWKTKR
jgi:hypothetical protein